VKGAGQSWPRIGDDRQLWPSYVQVLHLDLVNAGNDDAMAVAAVRRRETQVAGDGQPARERLDTFNADVIAADLVMPRVDGFELLRPLKERGDATSANRA